MNNKHFENDFNDINIDEIIKKENFEESFLKVLYKLKYDNNLTLPSNICSPNKNINELENGNNIIDKNKLTEHQKELLDYYISKTNKINHARNPSTNVNNENKQNNSELEDSKDSKNYIKEFINTFNNNKSKPKEKIEFDIESRKNHLNKNIKPNIMSYNMRCELLGMNNNVKNKSNNIRKSKENDNTFGYKKNIDSKNKKFELYNVDLDLEDEKITKNCPNGQKNDFQIFKKSKKKSLIKKKNDNLKINHNFEENSKEIDKVKEEKVEINLFEIIKKNNKNMRQRNQLNKFITNDKTDKVKVIRNNRVTKEENHSEIIVNLSEKDITHITDLTNKTENIDKDSSLLILNKNNYTKFKLTEPIEDVLVYKEEIKSILSTMKKYKSISKFKRVYNLLEDNEEVLEIKEIKLAKRNSYFQNCHSKENKINEILNNLFKFSQRKNDKINVVSIFLNVKSRKKPNIMKNKRLDKERDYNFKPRNEKNIINNTNELLIDKLATKKISGKIFKSYSKVNYSYEKIEVEKRKKSIKSSEKIITRSFSNNLYDKYYKKGKLNSNKSFSSINNSLNVTIPNNLTTHSNFLRKNKSLGKKTINLDLSAKTFINLYYNHHTSYNSSSKKKDKINLSINLFGYKVKPNNRSQTPKTTPFYSRKINVKSRLFDYEKSYKSTKFYPSYTSNLLYKRRPYSVISEKLFLNKTNNTFKLKMNETNIDKHNRSTSLLGSTDSYYKILRNIRSRYKSGYKDSTQSNNLIKKLV